MQDRKLIPFIAFFCSMLLVACGSKVSTPVVAAPTKADLATPTAASATAMPTSEPLYTPAERPTLTPAPPATAIPTPAIPAWEVIYKQTFGNGQAEGFQSPWSDAGSHSTWKISDGAYVGTFTDAGMLAWTQYWGGRDVDISLDITVEKLTGDVFNGVQCRNDPDATFQGLNYYEFVLFSLEGSSGAAIVRKFNGETIPLAGPVFSDGINPGEATNRLRAVCSGDRLELYVNDVLTAGAQDDALSEGAVYLRAEARAPMTIIALDNFIIRAPSASSP